LAQIVKNMYGLKPDIVGLSVYRWINPTAKDNFIMQCP